MAPRDTTGELAYLASGSHVNRRFVAPGAEINTGRYERHKVPIRDGRAAMDELTLATAGFTLAHAPSAVADFFDRDEVERNYPSEVADIVRRLTGADHVVRHSWLVRTAGDRQLLEQQTIGYGKGSGAVQPPGSDVHVDMTPRRATALAEALYAENFPGAPPFARFIVSSVWRPFSAPPQDWPLAICDGRSVGDEEGVANTMVIVDALPDETAARGPLPGEELMPAGTAFHYAAHHRWWYFSNMTRDEIVFLTLYDSDHSHPWRVPHTAFHDPAAPNSHTRRSIEFRTVAFFNS